MSLDMSDRYVSSIKGLGEIVRVCWGGMLVLMGLTAKYVGIPVVLCVLCTLAGLGL